MPLQLRKALARARVEISGDTATEIAAGGRGSPHRVRVFFPVPAPNPRPAHGALAQLVHDLSDRSERGDPKALFSKYGGALAPLLMSIPFMAVGVGMLIFLTRNTREIMPVVFGGVFALGGLFLFSFSISTLRSMAARAEPPPPEQPWRTDNRWNPRGSVTRAQGGASITGCLGLTLFFLLIGAFNFLWTVKKDPSGWIIFTIVVGVFDLLALLIAGSIVVSMFQRLRAGSPRLTWTKFPFFTGERFEATFTSGRSLSVTGSVRATLRCIEQVAESDEQGQARVNPYAIYAHSETFEPPAARLTSFDVSFDVPASVPGTDFSAETPVCWLLEIRAPVSGPDFSTQFLLPIYARASAR